ncbi:hypothetical protein BKA70DRAFT_1435291 [Coprinopsis sp. MPI-PUGE-AT-0042]|nr:hypothetical protein BKA70DRAFT_1435291 [Coprinopsis sp. MPI-PUGE-AT-0042]
MPDWYSRSGSRVSYDDLYKFRASWAIPPSPRATDIFSQWEEKMDIWLRQLHHARIAYRNWRMVDFSASILVNVVTTTMIIARLVLMQRKMNQLASGSDIFRSELPYRQIITLLLESALPFTLVALAGAIATAFLDPVGGTYRQTVHALPFVMVLWTNAMALGPQLIAFRVISGVTLTANPPSQHSRPISEPIMFAHDPVVSFVASFPDAEEAGGLEPAGLLSFRVRGTSGTDI